jgi:general nucleoside transport system ATP-binding protein
LALKQTGTAVLLVLADLDEIRALGDRIRVMDGGQIVSSLGPGASERNLGLPMSGSLAP